MADTPPKKIAFPFAPKSGVQPAIPSVSGSDPTPLPVDAGVMDGDDVHGMATRIEPPPDASKGSEHPTRISKPESTRVPLRDSNEAIPAPGPSASSAIPDNFKQLGPYTVRKMMARGGMGAVYYGEDEALNRKVAIKVMARELASDETSIARFQREARATATIEHPNVAMIYMVGFASDGSPFLAMEFVDGGTLEGKIRRRDPISISNTADMMIQCCEALNQGRKKGIIHRDIKPANIMLTAAGQVKVVDFGLAKFFNEDSFRTTAGTVMGTPRYMSPEQAQGREVDFRADVYALGATFYHLLAGRAPFDGDSPTQIMFKQVTSPIVPIRSINPDIPMEFDDVIRKCMAKDPNDRYQDYTDLISHLSHIKLQWMARERGATIHSIQGTAPVRVGTDGMPISPSAPAGASSASLPRASTVIGRPSGVVHIEEKEPVPMWRWAIIVGAGLLIVGIVLALVFGSSKEKEVAKQPGLPSSNTATAQALQALLQRFAGGGVLAAPQANVQPPNPAYTQYAYTIAMLNDLVAASESYDAEKGHGPPALSELIKGGYTTLEYIQAADGAPLDGWENALQFERATQTIRSAGRDGRQQTADDLAADPGSGVSTGDSYAALEFEERERQARARSGGL